MRDGDQLWVPSEVFEAARTLQTFFENNGIEDWCIDGVRSNASYEKLRASALAVTTQSTIDHMASKLNG